MAVRHFIEGLGDKGLRERVLGGRPISVEAAEEAAKYFVSYSLPMGIEPVVEAAKEKDLVNKESEVDKITKQLEKLSIQLAQMQQGRGGGLLHRPAVGRFKCYQCGKEGHMARDCTQKGRAALNVMQQVLEGKAPTIAEFLNGEEGKLDMLVGPRKRQAVRDPEGWGIDEAREELRKKLAQTGGAEEAAKGSRFVRRPRVSALPNSYNVVDRLKLTPVSVSVWNYISDSDKVRKGLLDALKLAEDKGKEDGAAAMQGVSIVAAAPRESRHEDPIPSNLVFQVPQCDVHLGKHRLTAIVDSGASQTALSHVIARKLGLLPYLQDTTIEYTTSSGETSKPWGILPDVPVRVGKLTLPIDIAVTGANTYDMLLGHDWIYSANADIMTSKWQIVYRVNTKETDSVPITTGPVGTGSHPSCVSLPPQTPHRNDTKPPQHWSGMNEKEFQRWLEEKQLLLAKEQGRIRLTEEEADCWAWVQEEEELDRAELEALELKEHEFDEELGADGLDGIPEAVEEKGEITDLLEGDSMTDGEEYLVEDKEEGELAYEGKGHRISPDYLFALFNYPAAERWQYLAAEKGDEGRIVLGSYYSLKKEATRVACPAFEDLPVSLNHELGMAQQTDLRKLLVEYREVFATEAEPLGTHPTVLHHIATGDGVKPDAGKVEAISMMAAPVDVRGVREFLGCTSYYRRFIKGYAKVAHSLTQLVHKDNPFEWTDKSGEESSSSVDGEGDGGDSGEEEGDEVDGREPEEMNSNTEKRDGEEEGEVGQAGSEESDDGDGDEGLGEEGDETDGSREGDGEDEEEEEEEEADKGDKEMVAPRVPKDAKGGIGETNPFEWDENICWVLLGYRASIHSSTEFSPFFLLYGRHPNITGSTLTEWEVKELTELSTEKEADAAAGIIYERSSEMELALAKAAENHDKAQEKEKVDFDRRRTLLEPIRIGDFIRIKPTKRVAWADQDRK
ncbi:unnamed protein product [Closterium sp. NIES-65]|nr:unnamed protein product [Closterium sp. NIES-65]